MNDVSNFNIKGLEIMRITACGDALIQRRIPKDYNGIDDIINQICKGEARFVNLETTLHNGEHFGNQFSGGSYLRADPVVLEDIKNYGFNMLTFANNHSFDFSYGGLLATKKAVDEAGILNSGVGENLDEAAAPTYLDTKNGRIALISFVSSMVNPAAMAGKQSRRVKGRPGVNGLRCDSYLQVTKKEFETVKQIALKSKINAQKDISRKEGFTPPLPDGVATLGELMFKEGSETAFVTHPNKEDLDRAKKAIYEAQMQADVILISIHSHEISGDSKENPADFIKEFAHECIDAGAHAIIGHGPHLLRPVEIYKGCPIFYSLGNFVLHHENVPFAPEEMYAKQNLTSDATMREVFCDRSANYTRGLMRDKKMLESVIPYFEIEDGKLTCLEFMPVELNLDDPVWRRGNPRFSKEHGIIERLAEMSKPYGVDIEIDDRGFGIVKF